MGVRLQGGFEAIAPFRAPSEHRKVALLYAVGSTVRDGWFEGRLRGEAPYLQGREVCFHRRKFPSTSCSSRAEWPGVSKSTSSFCMDYTVVSSTSHELGPGCAASR